MIAQQAKNGGGSGGGVGGGGGGNRSRAPQNDFGDRGYPQQSYNPAQGQHSQAQTQAVPQADPNDPYAACEYKSFRDKQDQ